LLHYSYHEEKTFFFDYAMYNMMTMFGIHFLFNFKIEQFSLVRLFVDRNIRRLEIFNNGSGSAGNDVMDISDSTTTAKSSSKKLIASKLSDEKFSSRTSRKIKRSLGLRSHRSDVISVAA
jgi:hypothetical protein